MSSWKNESVEYRNRLCERYGVIEEKFDKQAFNEDPIAYFESVGYKLKAGEWIPAMWNLFKLFRTDSRLASNQIGPNGYKVAQILSNILLKNESLRDQVESKMSASTLTESSLKRIDRLMNDEVLNEKKWKDYDKSQKIKIIIIIIAGIILVTIAALGFIGYQNGGASALQNATSFLDKLKVIVSLPAQAFKTVDPQSLQQVAQEVASDPVAQTASSAIDTVVQNAAQVVSQAKGITGSDIYDVVSAAVYKGGDALKEIQTMAQLDISGYIDPNTGRLSTIVSKSSIIQILTGYLKQALASGNTSLDSFYELADALKVAISV